MSRPLSPGISLNELDPARVLRGFVEQYRDAVTPVTHARLVARTRELGLRFADDELLVLAALDTPDKVQDFLNNQVYYNDDHVSPEQDETALPPRRVLQMGIAHCFEGALFAYAVNYLHGHAPQFMLLETTQDIEHNLVVYRDPQTGLFGCNAHSTYPGLDGRAAQFATLHALAESFYPYYYSVRSNDLSDIVLIGYSNPFDFVARFGVAWMDAKDHLWDIYYTYMNASVTFHYLRDDPGEPHLYPLIRALKENWIRIDAHRKGFVSVPDLPRDAQALWHAFWREHSDPMQRPSGDAVAVEKQFFALTGTTPIDLLDHADDLQWFLAAGYRVEQILTG
ncbi:MAG: hypothetical protein HY868_19945 [Chloroflexi bacterium]|nr:hypothetical protein [Chloroflexota bacterium]